MSQPCGPSNHILLRLFSTFLCAAVSWALLYILLPKEVTPGGKLLTLIFLLFASYFGGDLFKILGLPKLLGMLLTGIIMRNVGLYFDTNVQSVYTDVVATIRYNFNVIYIVGIASVSTRKSHNWHLIHLRCFPQQTNSIDKHFNNCRTRGGC